MLAVLHNNDIAAGIAKNSDATRSKYDSNGDVGGHHYYYISYAYFSYVLSFYFAGLYT